MLSVTEGMVRTFWDKYLNFDSPVRTLPRLIKKGQPLFLEDYGIDLEYYYLAGIA